MSQPKLSFTIRRPTPSASPQQSLPSSRSGSDAEPPPTRPTNGSRPAPPGLARAQSSFTTAPSPLAGARRRFPTVRGGDSSEEEGTEDEIITGFDELGVERANKPRETKPAPMIIPPLANRDWRQNSLAKRRAVDRFLPPGARERAQAEKTGEVDTKDVINAGPQLAGLTLMAPKVEEVNDEEMTLDVKTEPDGEVAEVKMEVEETLEQRAIRALLTGEEDIQQISTIPLYAPTETDAYREDVETRPDTPTMEDYARVPIEQFGAALLRGMGWKEGMAASRTRKGMDEPWVPKARPALLGLGAKARPEDTVVQDDKRKTRKPDMKYVPLVKRVAEVKANGDRSGSSSARSSDDEGRQISRSDPERARIRDQDRERERTSDPDRRQDSDRRQGSERDRDREPRRDRDRDAGRYSDRDDRRDRDRNRERPRSDRDKGWDSDRPSESRRDRDRDRRG